MSAAAEVDVLPGTNGGGDANHPALALLDVYTLRRELREVDGITMAVVGRANHRNVNALLMTLALFRDLQVILLPPTGGVNPDVVEYCRESGMSVRVESSITPFLEELNAVYVNGPETEAHTQLLTALNVVTVKIDQDLLRSLRPDCVILDPMQRSEPIISDTSDSRWAGYRQAENGLFVRMAILLQLLGS